MQVACFEALPPNSNANLHIWLPTKQDLVAAFAIYARRKSMDHGGTVNLRRTTRADYFGGPQGLYLRLHPGLLGDHAGTCFCGMREQKQGPKDCQDGQAG